MLNGILTDTNIIKVPELRQILKNFNLNTDGLKDELKTRLKEYIYENPVSVETASDISSPNNNIIDDEIRKQQSVDRVKSYRKNSKNNHCKFNKRNY